MTEFEKYFIPVYKRIEKVITGSEGCYLITEDGKYLDMFSGLGVNALGYNNTVADQIKKYYHISNYFEAEPAGLLAKYLTENTFTEKVFFANSGTEAIEAGMKIIRKYSKENNRPEIITFSKAFHGRTLASASVTEPDKSSSYNFPGVPNIRKLPFNDTKSLNSIGTNTAAVFLEVIQGQGGVNVATTEFVKKLRSVTEKNGVILITDEIQSGMGRTGKLFAFEHYGIVPDLCVTAKGIGGGLPLGALLAGEKFADYLGFGEHGSTFGGNPVSCAAGLAAIKQINRREFLDSVSEKGDLLLEKITGLKQKYPEKIGRISGKGLMIGIEILSGSDKIIDAFIEEKIFVNITSGNILRLLPPLIISEGEIGIFMKAFEKVLKIL
jgi:acetylornithine/N-succinyldiaminopimelate aminotransferase